MGRNAAPSLYGIFPSFAPIPYCLSQWPTIGLGALARAAMPALTPAAMLAAKKRCQPSPSDMIRMFKRMFFWTVGTLRCL